MIITQINYLWVLYIYITSVIAERKLAMHSDMQGGIIE